MNQSVNQSRYPREACATIPKGIMGGVGWKKGRVGEWDKGSEVGR